MPGIGGTGARWAGFPVLQKPLAWAGSRADLPLLRIDAVIGVEFAQSSSGISSSGIRAPCEMPMRDRLHRMGHAVGPADRHLGFDENGKAVQRGARGLCLKVSAYFGQIVSTW